MEAMKIDGAGDPAAGSHTGPSRGIPARKVRFRLDCFLPSFLFFSSCHMMVLGWFGWEGHWPDPRMTLPLLSLLAAGELELLLLPHDTGAKMWERKIY